VVRERGGLGEAGGLARAVRVDLVPVARAHVVADGAEQRVGLDAVRDAAVGEDRGDPLAAAPQQPLLELLDAGVALGDDDAVGEVRLLELGVDLGELAADPLVEYGSVVMRCLRNLRGRDVSLGS